MANRKKSAATDPAAASKPAARQAAPRKAATPKAAKQAPKADAAPAKSDKPAAMPRKKEKPAKAAKPGKPDKQSKPQKARKTKLVRDSFTMPATEYAQLAELKKRLLSKGKVAKKSELLRAGVALLASLEDADLMATMEKLAVIKTGRPAKAEK